MNIATTLIIAVVAVVALYFLVKKFPALERALFVSKNDPEAKLMGSATFYIAVCLGAVAGTMGFVYNLATNLNIFDLGFGSPLGLIFNIIPYLLFLDIAVCFYMAFAWESTTARRIARATFLLVSCALGFAGGVIGSILAICIVILAFLWKLLLAMMGVKPDNKKHENKEEEYDATVNEDGFERKLKEVGINRYQDDKGDYWVSDNDGSVRREK